MAKPPLNTSNFTITENEQSLTLNDNRSSKNSKTWKMFNSPIVFIVNLCVVNICQLMVASIFYGSMSSLEKRFSYNTQISSIIMVSDLFLSTILSPIIGFYATRFNRSKLIAYSSVFLGFACLLTSLPYFVYGPSTHLMIKESSLANSSSSNFELCPSSTHCTLAEKAAGATIWPAVLMLFLGNFFRGIGFTTYYVIALPYIDDTVHPQSSPIYISIMHGVSLVGRLSGYFFSAYFLSFYETPWNNPGIDQKDPRFIGAWWLGFFVTGILVILTSLPLFLYPSDFKTASTKTKTVQEIQKTKNESSFAENFRRFIQNPLLILFFLGNEFRYIGINGFYAFFAKYVQSHYRTTSAQASAITGTTGFAPVSIGLILGGVYISYFKPKAKLLFTIIFICELVSVGTIGSGLLLGCEPIKLDGAWTSTENEFSLQSKCNQDCECSLRAFSPVCGSDSQTTFFSPCHGGCKTYNETTSLFTDCSCFPNSGTSGFCPNDTKCDNLATWLILLTIGTFISSSARTGNSLITFRSCDPGDKSFTTGILSALLSLLAFIPCELFYGYIVDYSCLIWENKCGQKGNCWLYDQNKFRTVFLGVSTVFLILGSVFDFIIIFYAEKMKNLYGENDEAEETE